MAKTTHTEPRQKIAAPIDTPIDLSPQGVTEISEALNMLVADSFALYVKTKNFHWHVSGPHFRDYHLLLDDQAEEIFKTIDDLAERVRKLGGVTIRSISDIARLKRIDDNNDEFVPPLEMLRELMADNKALIGAMRETHETAAHYNDVGTTSMLEIFIDGAEKRNWFLFEASRRADQTGH